MSPHIFERRHEGEFDGGCGKGRSSEKMMMPAIDSFLVTWPPRLLSILRIIIGLLFLEHGTVEIFELASFAIHGSGPHVALRHQRHDRARRRGADRARLV